MRYIWAESTWASRVNLVDRFNKFCADNSILDPLQCLDWAITTFVESTGTAPSTRLTYSKQLGALYHRLGHVTPVLQMYQSSLRNSGALIPQHQAEPATQQQVEFLLKRAARDEDPRLVAAIFLAWKTASRWDEISRIIGASILLANSQEIVIEWLDRTKSTRGDPFRATSWTVVRHDSSMASVAATLSELADDETLTDLSTEQMVRHLRRYPETEQLTAHSFKRGVVDILFEKAANLELDGRTLVPLLAKHKSVLTDMPSVTLRYGSNRVAIARTLGTQEATLRVPCRLPEHQPPTPPQVPLELNNNFHDYMMEFADNQQPEQQQEQQQPRRDRWASIQGSLPGSTVMARVRQRRAIEQQQQQQQPAAQAAAAASPRRR